MFCWRVKFIAETVVSHGDKGGMRRRDPYRHRNSMFVG
jgi:hypothetical protein